MDRGMTGAMVNELGQAVSRPIHLLQVDFPGLTVRMTDAAVNLSWGGFTWTALQFLEFSGIDESADLVVSRCTVSLSGVDQSLVAAFLADDYFNRRAKIYKGFVTEALQVIVDPVVILDGRMDRPVVATDPDQGSCVCSVDIVSRFSPFQRAAGRHTNDAEQQFWFPGDKGFEHVTEGNDNAVTWGRAPDIWRQITSGIRKAV